jgi:transposase
VLAETVVHAKARGYAEALRFAAKHAAGARAWAVEGAGHYGAGLSRYLDERGETVLEIGRQLRNERRLRGKDDPLDAIRAARTGLAAEARTLPRSGEGQEALRVLLLARRSAVDVRRIALVQLRSVIVTAPEQLREELRRLPLTALIRRCSRFRRSKSRSPEQLAIVLALRSLARRIEAATAEAEELEQEILQHVRALVPDLLDEPGVGPIVAAQLIVTCHTATGFAPKAASPGSPASRRCRPRAARLSATDSAAAATVSSTARCTPSSSTAAKPPATTSPAASPKERAPATQHASSSATSPATSTA